MILYFIRHGKCDSDYQILTEEGINESRKIAKYLDRNFKINRIIHSDSGVSKNTAEIIQAEFQVDIAGVQLSEKSSFDEIREYFELLKDSDDKILFVTNERIIWMVYHIVNDLAWSEKKRDISPTHIFIVESKDNKYMIRMQGCENYISSEAREESICPKCRAEMTDCCNRCGYMSNGNVVDVRKTTGKEKKKNRISAFISVNVDTFFERHNWPSVFLGALYFLYRKMYLIGIILLFIEVITFQSSFFLMRGFAYIGMPALGFAIIWGHLWIRGILYYMFTTQIYLWWVNKRIEKLGDQPLDIIEKHGGTNILAPIIGIFLIFLIYLVTMIMK